MMGIYTTNIRAAFNGSFKEAEQKNFSVDATYTTMAIVLGWLYTGMITGLDGVSDFHHLTKVYIFADQKDIVALRRQVLAEISISSSATVPAWASVDMAYSHLPESSQFRQFLMARFVAHWDYSCDGDEAEGARREAIRYAPKEFLYDILVAQSRHRSEGAFAIGDDPHCRCCHDICSFHEHESNEGREASKDKR